MKIPRANQPSKLSRTTISDETHADIGRLIRAFAEIDDMLTAHISDLAHTSESRGSVLLGRSPISTKIAVALYLAKMEDQTAIDVHNSVFDADEFKHSLKCRNAVAHGALLGENENGELSFLTTTTLNPDNDAASMEVLSYTPDRIKACANAMTDAVPRIEKVLKLSALRERRLLRSLEPHPKGQNQQKRSK